MWTLMAQMNLNLCNNFLFARRGSTILEIFNEERFTNESEHSNSYKMIWTANDQTSPMLSLVRVCAVQLKKLCDLAIHKAHSEDWSDYADAHFASKYDISYNHPASILYKSIADRYRPVSYPDGPITARYTFIKNAYWAMAVIYI